MYISHASRKNNLYAINGICVRKRKWLKAEHVISNYAQDTERQQIEELYDLDADLSEKTELASRHPELVTQLRERMGK